MSLTLKLLLLLLLVLSYHVDSGSIVKFLPGFEGPLPFELETGHIGIGEEEEVQLFYYFIKSEKNPKEDPLLIWLNGGPGCSSLVGLLLENGPVALKFEVYNGSLASLVSTTYSWTQVANIIFLDQPVGAGFSYSRTPLDKTSDTNEVKMIHEFLQKYYVYYLIESWANNEKVREALHVQKGTKGHWKRCNRAIPYNQDIISSVPYHMNNSISGYRSLIYSGDHDMTMPFLATQAWIKSLNYSIIEDWRPWMIKSQIAGYTRTYSNKMTFSTIKGSGHTAEYKPNETFIMFQRWINGNPL